MSEDHLIKTFVFFDLEATGLLCSKSKITELSMVAVHRFELVPGSKTLPRVMNKLILCFNPRKLVSYEVFNVTGLDNTNLYYQGQFTAKTVDQIDIFLGHLEQPLCLLAHNGNNFDFPLLKTEIESTGKHLSCDPFCADTLEAFRALDGIVTAPSIYLGPPLVCPLTNGVYSLPPATMYTDTSIDRQIQEYYQEKTPQKKNIDLPNAGKRKEEWPVTPTENFEIKKIKKGTNVKRSLFPPDELSGSKDAATTTSTAIATSTLDTESSALGQTQTTPDCQGRGGLATCKKIQDDDFEDEVDDEELSKLDLDEIIKNANCKDQHSGSAANIAENKFCQTFSEIASKSEQPSTSSILSTSKTNTEDPRIPSLTGTNPGMASGSTFLSLATSSSISIATTSQTDLSKTPVCISKSANIPPKASTSARQYRMMIFGNKSKTSYKLGEIHNRLLGNYPQHCHRAEDDCLALIRIVQMQGDDILQWLNENCVEFRRFKSLGVTKSSRK